MVQTANSGRGTATGVKQGSVAARFRLALVIIIPTFLLIFSVLFLPGSQVTFRFANGTQVVSPSPTFAERVDALKILLGVMGVWVGAVVAFYFGAESLEKANEATKQAIQALSPTERLRQKLAKDNMLTPVFSKKPGDTIKDFKDYLRNNPSGYIFDYLLIADDSHRPLGMLHDYEVEDYIVAELTKGNKIEDINQRKISEVMAQLKWGVNEVRDNFVKVHPEEPLSIVKDLLQNRKLRVAYVTDYVGGVEVAIGVVSLTTILGAALV